MIGTTSTGTKVYRTRGQIDGRPVAIKVIQVSAETLTKYKQSLEEVLQEPRLYSKLDPHPNLVQYHHTMIQGPPESRDDSTVASFLKKDAVAIPGWESSPYSNNNFHNVSLQQPNSRAGLPNLVQEEGFSADASSEVLSDSWHQDGDQFEGEVFMVQELCNDGDLDKYIQKTSYLPPRLKLDIISNVLDGISHLHNHGILHLDIKPKNVLLTRIKNGKIVAKVCDLGLSRELGQHQDTLALMHCLGTPFYGSPEQWAPQPFAGTFSDVSTKGMTGVVHCLSIVADPKGSLPFC